MVKMLKNEASRTSKNIPDASIPPSTVFTGDIETAGGVRVDGTVKGKVYAGGDVTVGLQGIVEGGIKACNVNIAGKIIGNVTATGAVQMLSGSKLVGDLTSSSFAIEQGAYYKGQCTITGSEDQALLHAAKEPAAPDEIGTKPPEAEKNSSDAGEPDAAECDATAPEETQTNETKTTEGESEADVFEPDKNISIQKETEKASENKKPPAAAQRKRQRKR